MAPKNVFTAVICAALLACAAASATDAYRPDEFLGLDLSTAALSPKPLGPASGFTPVPAETTVDRGAAEPQARLEPKVEPRIKAKRSAIVRSASVVHMRAVKPRGSVRTKLARRHTNPLDAQAFDTRIQVWPCRSGGICDWKRSGN
jgi:hypothetical protein